MQKSYDIIVIGTGSAAMTAATRLRKAGKSVSVIDFRPYGGTCALRGCDPKKMLISGAEVIDGVHRMATHGVVGDAHIEWPDLIKFKRSFTDPVPKKHLNLYHEQGIETYNGVARFMGPDVLQVEGDQLTAKHFVIATGAEPVKLNIPGEEHAIDNEAFLSMEKLPERVVLVGGGYIAAEFSHIAARAGAQVTILQHGDRMLTQFDPELVSWLMEKFRELKIDIQYQTSVVGIEKTSSGFIVRASSNGSLKAVETDLVVHAAGRAPALKALNLEAAQVETTDIGRLKLNEFLQSTSNPRVYAAGDAAQMGPPLTPVSSHDAKVVVANLLEGNHKKPNYSGVPSVAFTIPPIAMVGMSEAEAKSKNLKFKMKSQKVPEWYTARRVAEKVYGFKVLIEESTDKILGAHLVGPHVDEVINIFALAIRNGLTSEDLKETMFAYPTGASDVGYML